MKNNILENLELKLINTRLENAEKIDKIEAEYKEKYSDFFDNLLSIDNLWFKRFISVSFQLDKLNNPDKKDENIFNEIINKSIKLLPLNNEDKKIFEWKILNLFWKNDKINDFLNKNNDLRKDYNYIILESLEKNWLINWEDILKISLKYKENNSFIDSLSVLDIDKKDLIKKNFYDLNDSKSSLRIEKFENDFSEDLDNSKQISYFPKITKFVWKNYYRLRLKWKLESKKDALRRVFKTTFLKLYRLKYSGLDINSIIKKIESLDDLDSMINLLLKFFEQLKDNPSLASDYTVLDDIDEVSELFTQAEENKEKVLFNEQKTIKASKILEAWDKKISLKNLDDILSDNLDLVWENFVVRELSAWIKADWEDLDNNEEDEEETESDLYEKFEELKEEFSELDKKKLSLFLTWDYDWLDLINEEILSLTIKLEKISALLWLEY